jgi:hypothetical protein
MSEVFLNLAVGLISGVPGYLSAAYLLWNRRKGTRVYAISGVYETEQSSSKDLVNIKTTIEIGFLNESDQSISITDVVGLLRYNKGLYDDVFSSINTPTPSEVYSEKPENLQEAMNFSIPPHQTVKKTIMITFPDMRLMLVDRVGIARFGGFLDGKIPCYVAHETELKEKWTANPLALRLLVHIDGRKIHRTFVPLFHKSNPSMGGTLLLTEIEKEKMDYRKEGYESTSLTLAVQQKKRVEE